MFAPAWILLLDPENLPVESKSGVCPKGKDCEYGAELFLSLLSLANSLRVYWCCGYTAGKFSTYVVAYCIHGSQEQCFHNLISFLYFPKFTIWKEFLDLTFEPNFFIDICKVFVDLSQSIMSTSKAVSVSRYAIFYCQKRRFIFFRFIIIIQLLFSFPLKFNIRLLILLRYPGIYLQNRHSLTLTTSTGTVMYAN